MADVLGKSLIAFSGPILYQLFVFCLNEGSIHEIDSFITLSRRILPILPQSHPHHPLSVLCLGFARFKRYMLSNQKEDLAKSIFHLTESTLLPPRSWLEHGPLVLHALFLLARALVQRSKVSNQLEDAIYAAKYLPHLRDQPHAAFGFPRHAITALLVDVLAFQVESEASDVVQCIEEIALLCHELLTLDAIGKNLLR